MKELIIDSDWAIKWKNITDRDRIEKISIEINDEIFSILSDVKTPIQEVRKIVNDILQWIIDYE